MSETNATQRFTGLADKYAKYRPDYPSAAIDSIMDNSSLHAGDLLIDIGCGTGISSRLFADRGLRVIGVEPNDEMRKAGEQQPHANIEFQRGTGEHTGLESSIADAALAAQAFHWFDPQTALSEFHRILKPGGWIILMWNERDESDPFTGAYGQLLRSLPETGKVEMRRGSAGEPLLTSAYFKDARKLAFKNQQSMDEEGLLGRAFSTSYVPQQFPDADILADRLRQLFHEYQRDERVVMHYETSVYLGHKL